DGAAPDQADSEGLGHTNLADLLQQILLENDQVIRMSGIPADADDVVADGDGEVDEFALVVHALAADVLVTVVLGPGLLGVLQLAGDAVAAQVGQDAAEPVIEHSRLQLETHPETDRLFINAGQERQHVVAAHKSALEEIRLALGAEHLVIELHRLREEAFVGDDDVCISQGGLRGDGELYRAAGGILFTKKPRMYIRGFENLLPQTINQPGAGRGPPPRPGRTSGSAFVLPG